MRRAAALLVFAAALALPASAAATFPGKNGKIAFTRGGDIWTMNPDGSGQVNLTNTGTAKEPAWSPDGAKIAFTGPNSDIYVMSADGSNVVDLAPYVTTDRSPAWSPDGARIAFLSARNINVMNADGSNRLFVQGNSGYEPIPYSLDWSPDGRAVTWSYYCWYEGGSFIAKHEPVDSSGTTTGVSLDGCQPKGSWEDSDPSWSPDAQRILFDRHFGGVSSSEGLYTIKSDGTDEQQLRSDTYAYSPVWSPDGSKIAFQSGGRIKVMNANNTGVTDVTDGADPNWQSIPITAYARPRGATPFRVSLVPANTQCTAPNSTHGAPLAFGSCSPPALTSQYLTTGTPDANGRSARMNAYLLLKAVAGNSTPPDEADVEITAHLNDVANKNLSDYTGGLRAVLPLRVTDKDNTPAPGGPGAATTTPFQYGFDIPCTTDPDPGIGSDCSITTTADTLVPGTIKESLRTVWQIGRARVDDGGSDGDPSTTTDNTVFAVQGVFIP